MKTIIRNFLSIFRRFKMATILNILGLSVAFAACMVIIMQLDYDYNFDRMHKHSDTIYRFELSTDKGSQAVLSPPLAQSFINSSPHIIAGSICSFYGKEVFQVEVNGEKNSIETDLILTKAEFTDVFEFDMLYGTAKAMGSPEGAIISATLSKKIFGNESALDKTIIYNQVPMTIGGVYKDFPDNSTLTNGIYKSYPSDEDFNAWRNFGYHCFIRVDSPENSRFLVDNFKRNFDSSQLADGFQWVLNMNYRLEALTDLHFNNDTEYDAVPKSNRQALPILFAIAIIIIVIAGINFTNFSTALAPMRIKSINAQKILGAEQSVIRTSLILEAVIISFISYLIALFLVYIIPLTSIRNLLDAEPSLSMHPFIIGGMALLAVLTGLIAGLYPSYYMTSFPPAMVLKGGSLSVSLGRFKFSPGSRKLRNILIGTQYLASFALIIGALFMYLQNKYMQTNDLGYSKDRLIVTNINDVLRKNKDAFAEHVKALAEIEDISFAHTLISSSDNYWGRGVTQDDKYISYDCLVVDPSFPQLMEINIVEGRDFREDDKLKEGGVLIFNERARNEYQLEIGQKIGGSEIVGFASNIKFASFRTEVVPMAFWLGGHREPEYAYIKVKKGSDMQKAREHIQVALNSFDKGYPFHLRFFDSIFEETYVNERKFGSLILLFSLLAIFISIVGVFGLVVFESEYRKKEVGIRKVLGSTVREIILLFNKSYIRILAIGFVLAVPLSYYAILKWLENFAYKTPMHWWVFAVAFIMVSIITVFTVTFQNWRTANMNPVESIRTE